MPARVSNERQTDSFGDTGRLYYIFGNCQTHHYNSLTQRKMGVTPSGRCMLVWPRETAWSPSYSVRSGGVRTCLFLSAKRDLDVRALGDPGLVQMDAGCSSVPTAVVAHVARTWEALWRSFTHYVQRPFWHFFFCAKSGKMVTD